MAEPRARTLVPGYLGLVSGRLWVFDRLQPTAVVLDPDTGDLLERPSWPLVQPSPTTDPFDPDGEWRIRADSAGVWVQQRTGPVASVTEQGLTAAFHSAGLTMSAYSAHGVWCLPAKPRPDVALRADAPPNFRGFQTQVQLIPTGSRLSRDITVATPVVHTAHGVNGDLYLLIEERTGHRTTLGPSSHLYRPDLQWTRLRADQPVPDQLERHHLEPAQEPAQVLSQRNAGRLWSTHPGHLGQRTETAAGQAWRVAHQQEQPGAATYATAWTVPQQGDDTAPGAGLQVDLGPGVPIAVLGTDRHLWVAVEGPRLRNTFTRPTPAALLRVDARSGRVDTVLPADSVDITDQSWPLGPAPIDAEDYAHFWHKRLSLPMTGRERPLATGVSAGRADLAGTWPETAVHLTFDLDARPGTRWRRIVPLYDELGRPTPPTHAITHLWEQLETDQLPSLVSRDEAPVDI